MPTNWAIASGKYRQQPSSGLPSHRVSGATLYAIVGINNRGNPVSSPSAKTIADPGL
jgi:hypothetical protein